MEKGKNKNGVIALLIVVIIILALLCYLFATDTISLNTNKINDNKDKISNDDRKIYEENKNTVENNKISIKILDMETPNINTEAINHTLSVEGKMELSFDESEVISVSITGYCLGQNNEKYVMIGPESGLISFHNGDTEFKLVNTINNNTGDVIYTDGTVKYSNEIDWNNVKIKYCNIEKSKVIYKDNNGNTSEQEVELNFKKNYS